MNAVFYAYLDFTDALSNCPLSGGGVGPLVTGMGRNRQELWKPDLEHLLLGTGGQAVLIRPIWLVDHTYSYLLSIGF